MHTHVQWKAEGCEGGCGHWVLDQLLEMGTWNCALKAWQKAASGPNILAEGAMCIELTKHG